MSHWTFVARNERETERLGAALAQVLPDGVTLALCGTLGCGKTRLTQALAEACGAARRDVTSPTFVLCQEYAGRRTIYHLDAYRIRDENEFWELGAEEYFQSSGITIVEWADRVIGCLPPQRIELHVQVTGEQSRQFEVLAVGDRYRAIPAELASRLKSG